MIINAPGDFSSGAFIIWGSQAGLYPLIIVWNFSQRKILPNNKSICEMVLDFA